MVVDPEGNAWRLKLSHIGVKVADIRERLDGLANDLPTVSDAQKFAEEKKQNPLDVTLSEEEQIKDSWVSQVYDYTAHKLESFKTYMKDLIGKTGWVSSHQTDEEREKSVDRTIEKMRREREEKERAKNKDKDEGR